MRKARTHSGSDEAKEIRRIADKGVSDVHPEGVFLDDEVFFQARSRGTGNADSTDTQWFISTLQFNVERGSWSTCCY